MPIGVDVSHFACSQCNKILETTSEYRRNLKKPVIGLIFSLYGLETI